jgi:hypothetical protein
MDLNTSLLRERKIVTTTVRQYDNRLSTTFTVHTENTYTSDNLSIVGKSAEVYFVVDGKTKRWTGTIQSYSGVQDADPLPFRDLGGGQTESNIFVGPYQQTISLRNISISVSKVEVVEYCPWGISEGRYTVVLNSDFAVMSFINYRWCNLVETPDSIAKVYVAFQSQYVSGATNYVSVWEFVEGGTGAIAVKRDDESGKTVQGNTGESSQCIQYFPV